MPAYKNSLLGKIDEGGRGRNVGYHSIKNATVIIRALPSYFVDALQINHAKSLIKIMGI